MDRISYFIRLLSEKHRVIYDTNIGASREYNEELASLIFESSIVVAFISESYLKSSYCLDELLFARENNIPILLVYLEKIDLSNGLRMRLGRFQALSINSSDIANRIFEIKEVKDCEIKSQSVESEPEEEEHTDGLRSARFLSDLKQNEYIERTDGGWMTDGSWSCAVIPGIRDNTETNKSEPFILDLFFIIEDYKVFNEILENKSKPSMQGFFENILEKGYLHNIHFIVGTTENKSTSFISRLFELVKRENSGIVLGYPLASQSIIDGPLPFSEQNRIPERGKGNLVLSDYAGIVQIPSVV